MKSQAESWELFKTLGDIDDVYVIEAMRGLAFEDKKKEQKTAGLKGKVVKFLPRVLLAAVLIAIQASAMGDSSLLDTAKAKTAALDLTNQELQDVCDYLALQHITPGVLSRLEPLERNDNGLICGFASPVTDLAVTLTDEGEKGYSYYKDWWGNIDDPPDVKYYKLTHTRKLPVYEKDGKTLIGFFAMGWLWPPETPHIGWR